MWAKAVGGTGIDGGSIGTGNSDLRGISIAFGTSGNMYMTGVYKSPSITFGSTTLTNAGGYDIFIAKLDTVLITGNNDVSAMLNMATIFPNPFSNYTSISFSLSQSQNVSIKIRDASGRLVAILAEGTFIQGDHQIVWNAGDVEDGMYLLQFQSSGILQTEKVIVTNR